VLRNVRDLLLVPLSNTPEERRNVLPCSLVDVWTVFYIFFERSLLSLCFWYFSWFSVITFFFVVWDFLCLFSFYIFYSTILFKGLKFSVLLNLVYFGSMTVQKFKLSTPKKEVVGVSETSLHICQITRRNIQDTVLSVKPQTAQ